MKESQYGDLSTSLRFGRDDRGWVGEGERSLRDTLPFAKNAKGRAPGLCESQLLK